MNNNKKKVLNLLLWTKVFENVSTINIFKCVLKFSYSITIIREKSNYLDI